MTDLDIRLRHTAVNDEARRLGYRIEVELELNRSTYTAVAHPLGGQPTASRFLCRSSSELEALKDGLEILRGVVERVEPWPEDR